MYIYFSGWTLGSWINKGRSRGMAFIDLIILSWGLIIVKLRNATFHFLNKEFGSMFFSLYNTMKSAVTIIPLWSQWMMASVWYQKRWWFFCLIDAASEKKITLDKHLWYNGLNFLKGSKEKKIFRYSKESCLLFRYSMVLSIEVNHNSWPSLE